MKLVPDPPAVVRTLRTAPVLEDVRAFLELAHKQVDAETQPWTDRLRQRNQTLHTVDG